MITELCYKMNHRKRGTFVIFCYSKTKIDEQKSTESTKVYKVDDFFYEDVKYLEDLALVMGFEHEDIILFESLTYLETEQALVNTLLVTNNSVTEEVQRAGKDQDCLVCVILSHGSENRIICTQDKPISIDNFTYLISKSCPVLLGKPKIILKASCMGLEKMNGNKINSENIKHRNSALNKCNKFGKNVNHKKSTGNEEFVIIGIDETSSRVSIPINKDFLIFNSTVEGFVSFVRVVKNTKTWKLANGTCQYSLHALLELFIIHGLKKDFLQILTDTCYLVSNYSKQVFTNYKYQMNMPSIENQLCKKLYFNSKIRTQMSNLNTTPKSDHKKFNLSLRRRLSQFIGLNGSLTSYEEIVINLGKKFFVSSSSKPLYECLKDETKTHGNRENLLRKRINASFGS